MCERSVLGPVFIETLNKFLSPGKLVFLDVLINKIALIIIWLVQGHDENKKRCSKAIKWICHYMKTKYAYTLSLIDVLTYHNHMISLSLFLNSAHKIRLVTIASFETAHMSGYLCECRSGQRHLRHCTVGGWVCTLCMQIPINNRWLGPSRLGAYSNVRIPLICDNWRHS